MSHRYQIQVFSNILNHSKKNWLNQHTSVLAWEAEIGNPLLAEAHLPPHSDVVLRLAFLHLLVIVSLLLDQGTKDVLVLVGILIPKRVGVGMAVGGANER